MQRFLNQCRQSANAFVQEELGQGTTEFNKAIKISGVVLILILAVAIAAQNGFVQDDMFRKIRLMASSSQSF